ncbi:translation initiation factor IF-3 [Escherichia coli]|uniref:Translation initiation factor IF-3 n=1 Tax=Escherichia coli TaxID=562 RepID=A0A377A150_ECOLX|nr:translation initiation factor IF-3 [Escherichia coli]
MKRASLLRNRRKSKKLSRLRKLNSVLVTDEGDYQVKLRSLIRFLEEGDKAKITLRFRGREMAHQQIGMEVLNRVKDDLQELAVVESFPTKIEGRQMIMVLAPKKKQ